MNDVFTPPYSILKTHVDISEQSIDYWHSLIGVQEAHLKNKGGKAVIYILDTAKEWLANDISKEGNALAYDGTGQPNDAGNHGHLCAGIAGASDNEIGALGVAPDSLLIPVKGLHVSSGSYTWIISCLDYIMKNYRANFANSRVGIINMSFGGPSDYQPLRDKLEECINAGLIPVAAAGNTGGEVTYPGAWDDVCITVPALDANSLPASFSARGPATDIAGYGVAVISTAPNNTYPRVSGTSFSSPMVAGICAVVGTEFLSAFIPAKADNKELMETHLKKYAKDILEPGEDDQSGAGIPVIPVYLENNPIEKPDDPGDDPDKGVVTYQVVGGELRLKIKKDNGNNG